MSAPVIAVTGPRRKGGLGWSGAWLALRRAGASPRRVRPPYDNAQLDGISGVVIGGGTHVEPTRYEQEHLQDYLYDRERDALEWQVLGYAMEHRLPLLGICRGAQVLNIYCGGSLFQDLIKDLPGITLRDSYIASKRIAIEPESMVAAVMGVQAVRVNSLHRQGIDRLGRGLRIAARDDHGIVQAIEWSDSDGAGRFAIGVQWHPEYLPLRPAHQRLFGALVEAARARVPVPTTSYAR